MSKDPGTQNEPVMDGATDDMSEPGTPKTEASQLQQEGRDDEIDPPTDAEDAV